MSREATKSRTKKVKILHVFGRMARGGAEMRTVDLLACLNSHYEFHFATLTGRPGELDNLIIQLGGSVVPTPLDWRFPWRFRTLLKSEGYDVVHSHVHLFSGLILLLAALNKVPVRIAHFRNSDDGHGNGLRRRFQRELMRTWIDRFATHILAVSESTMNAVWPTWRQDERCEVIYNGLQLDPFKEPADQLGVRRELHIPADRNLFIHVGRFSEAKNHKRVISIFTEILKLEPRSHLLLVGGGSSEIHSGIRQQIADDGITEHVTITGVRSDVARLMKAADLLLFPSFWEGLPGAVLEACAAGVPTLGSDIESIREIQTYFSSVFTLSLEESDRTWAQLALQLTAETAKAASEGYLALQQNKMLEHFTQTPFDLVAVAKAFDEIYSVGA